MRGAVGSMHGVDHAARAQEQQRLEERVRREVKDAAAYAPLPTPRNMYPSWEMVEYASTFLMSTA